MLVASKLVLIAPCLLCLAYQISKSGDIDASHVIRSPDKLGKLIRAFRQSSKMTRTDLAGLANTGNRFIVDSKKGKPTIKLGLALKIVDLMGYEISIKREGE